MTSLPPIFKMGMDYPGFGINVEILVMKEYLKNLKIAVDSFCNKYIELEMRKYSGAEYDEYQHVYAIAEDEIPRVIRTPLVVSIYAIYENSITQLLSHAMKRENKNLSVKDIYGRSKTGIFNKYLKLVLEYDFQISNKQIEKISALTKIRNIIAHTNGNIEQNNSFEKEILNSNALKSLGIILDSDKIDVSYSFLETSMKDVEEIVKSLMNYMEHRYGAKE